MSPDLIITIISNATVVIGAGFMWYWQSKRNKKDLVKTDVDTGQVAIDSTADALTISRDAAQQVKEMREELRISNKNHEREMENLRMEIDELKFEAMEKDAMIEALKDWAERLVRQVRSYDRIPVEFKTPAPVMRK